MVSSRFAFLILLLLEAVSVSAHAAESMPGCARLDHLWRTRYYSLLRPTWPLRSLACESQQTDLEVADLALAQASYVLDSTRFSTKYLPTRTLSGKGKVGVPPASMLEWIGVRSRGIVYDLEAQDTHADTARGEIHLLRKDFVLKHHSIPLAAQLIHEARHLGIPVYYHVKCDVGTVGEWNCDPSLTENFTAGGSHATAALWLAWIANRSEWPLSDRAVAAKVIHWVLDERINDSQDAKRAWLKRYLGE